MGKRMQPYLIIALIFILVVAVLLAVAIYIQIQQRAAQSEQTINALRERVTALEQANRKSLNHLTADELMAASYALNLFRSHTELLDNANEHLRKAMNPEKYTKKQ